MYLIKPSYQILSPIEGSKIIQFLEMTGRICYKSECRIDEGTASKFVANIVSSHHLSVIEHYSVSVKFVVDRGVSHELVRHRLASYSQESTRYVNYAKKGVVFIIPPWTTFVEGEYNVVLDGDESETVWFNSMLDAEVSYLALLSKGWTPQQARSVLPNSLKTEIIMTANLREWKHVFEQRCAPTAHPQMREVMIPLQKEFRFQLPEIYGV